MDDAAQKGVPRGALRDHLLERCDECGGEVYRCSNDVALDAEPDAEGDWWLLPLTLTTMAMAASGPGPEGAAHYRLHEHQPEESA